MYACEEVCVCMSVSVCGRLYASVCMSIHICVFECEQVYVHTGVYLFVHQYVLV